MKQLDKCKQCQNQRRRLNRNKYKTNCVMPQGKRCECEVCKHLIKAGDRVEHNRLSSNGEHIKIGNGIILDTDLSKCHPLGNKGIVIKASNSIVIVARDDGSKFSINDIYLKRAK